MPFIKNRETETSNRSRTSCSGIIINTDIQPPLIGVDLSLLCSQIRDELSNKEKVETL